MSEPSSSTQEAAITRALRRLLAGVWPLRDRYHALVAAGPTPDSLAARHDRDRLDRLALEYARQQWGLCQDNLIAYEAVLAQGIQPQHAHASLLRQAIEGAVTCRWLIEPDLPDDKRRLRGVKADRRDHEDRAEWERAAGVADVEITGREATAKQRLAVLREAAEALGIEWKKMHPIGVTWLFRNYYVVHPRYGWESEPDALIAFNGTTLYQALSGLAHSRAWAHVLLSSVEEGGTAPGVTGSRNARLSANGYLALRFTGTAMATLEVALEELASYCGRLQSQSTPG